MTAPLPFEAWAKPGEAWAKPGKDAFDFWISFFPSAPLFGVEWRFAGMLPPLAGMAMPDEALFPNLFPGDRACAAARPGEIESPACADDGLTEPAESTTADAGATAGAAGKAADTTQQASMDFASAAAAAATPDWHEAPITDAAPAGIATGNAAEANATEATRLFDSCPDDADDLKTMKGIGPGLERQLNELGIWKFGQIAAMSEDDLAQLDARLTTVKGRCFRDDWIGQARQLAQ